MSTKPVDTSRHTFNSDKFESFVAEALDFFDDTPLIPAQELEKFNGTGVYGIYYSGSNPLYSDLSKEQKDGTRVPIYVGKAVPSGSRQGRLLSQGKPKLYRRLSEHLRSIKQVENLSLEAFEVRFILLTGDMVDIIVTVESALIRKRRPLWNSRIDGFGNHDPGKGRYQQQPSEWDTLHPGRSWADRLEGEPRDVKVVRDKVRTYIERQDFRSSTTDS